MPPPEYSEAEKLFTEKSWARLSGSIAHTAETGIPYELEVEMIRAYGEQGWMLGRGEVVQDTNGNTIALRGIAADITERKNTEIELINEKAFSDKLINIQVDIFFWFNSSTAEPLRWNESFSKVSGYSDEVIAKMKAPDAFLDEIDLKRAKQTIDKTFAEGESGVELNHINYHQRSFCPL